MVFQLCFREVALRLRWPFLLATVATALALIAHPDSQADVVDTAAYWLHLPTLVLLAAGIAATLEAWPLFGRERTGRSHLARLSIGPLDGCGSATAAGCLALWIAVAAVGVTFELLRGRPLDREIEAPVVLEADPEVAPRLGTGAPRLLLKAPGRPTVEAVLLRPQAFFPVNGVMEPVVVELILDGEPLGDGPVRIDAPGDLVRFDFAPRSVERLELVRRSERGLELYLPPGSVRALKTGGHDPLWNALGSASCAVVAAAMALSAACLGRRALGLPVLAVLALGVVVAASALGFTPNAPAIGAYARDEWFWSGETTAATIRSLATATVAMLGALWIPRPGRNRWAAAH